MNAAKKIRKMIAKEQGHPDAEVLRRLARALEEEQDFPLQLLYEIQHDHFELALELMRDWRLDRHIAARIKLFALLGEVNEQE